MAKKLVRYFQHPSFTAEEWSQRNPYLKKGEIGFLYDDVLQRNTKLKCGPGYWNELEFLGEDEYPYSEAVSNETGDAKGVLKGKTVSEILNLMLSPYQAPEISGPINNAGGTYQGEWILEIGTAINNVGIQYVVLNEANLSPDLPINVTAGGRFGNEGNFANGPVTLIPSAPIVPTLTTTIEILIKALDKKGAYSEAAKTLIKVFPKLIWGVSDKEDLTATEFFNIGQKRTRLSDGYKGDYDFNGAGYPWIGIPAMVGPSGLIFADATNPIIPGAYDMTPKGTLSVNNGLTTYDYVMYRGTEYQLESSVLRIG